MLQFKIEGLVNTMVIKFAEYRHYTRLANDIASRSQVGESYEQYCAMQGLMKRYLEYAWDKFMERNEIWNQLNELGVSDEFIYKTLGAV